MAVLAVVCPPLPLVGLRGVYRPRKSLGCGAVSREVLLCRVPCCVCVAGQGRKSCWLLGPCVALLLGECWGALLSLQPWRALPCSRLLACTAMPCLALSNPLFPDHCSPRIHCFMPKVCAAAQPCAPELGSAWGCDVPSVSANTQSFPCPAERTSSCSAHTFLHLHCILTLVLSSYQAERGAVLWVSAWLEWYLGITPSEAALGCTGFLSRCAPEMAHAREMRGLFKAVCRLLMAGKCNSYAKVMPPRETWYLAV